MQVEEQDGERTVLGTIIKAIDPATGKKLSELDVRANATILVYHLNHKN